MGVDSLQSSKVQSGDRKTGDRKRVAGLEVFSFHLFTFLPCHLLSSKLFQKLPDGIKNSADHGKDHEYQGAYGKGKPEPLIDLMANEYAEDHDDHHFESQAGITDKLIDLLF